MAFVEDILGGNLVAVATIGATAVLLPKILPGLPVPVRSVLKDSVSLFLEAESEAEGGIIERLAEQAMKTVLESLDSGETRQQRHEAAQAAVEQFKHKAHTRSARYGHNDHDRASRYKRHVARLKHKLERAGHKGAHPDAMSELVAALDKRHPLLPEDNPHGSA